MVKASAPGKCILFGEHAVVYGQPAVACSINQRMVVELEEEHKFNSWRLDGAILNFSKHPHTGQRPADCLQLVQQGVGTGPPHRRCGLEL